MAWYSGQEGGTALARIISGKVSPSGRLPFTFWGSIDKNPASANYYQSKPYGNRTSKRYSKRYSQYPFVEYSEGIFLGYRGMSHFGVEPMFPLGYGLTYSKFDYSGLSVEPSDGGYKVSFTVTNTGKASASEVAQLYISAEGSSVIKADLELKGYEKVSLDPKKSAGVTVFLPKEAFSHYDVSSHSWVYDPGQYKILAGASALDTRLSEIITAE